ncbi:hypothetical protein [Streptomyces sp. B6B3]|uniref:hypothetical protein n=1 Tax=Streptomyces sp. B6B3 TaxID=3153570 RepID=UPI00325ED995
MDDPGATAAFDGELSAGLRDLGWTTGSCSGCRRTYFTRNRAEGCGDPRSGCGEWYRFVGRRAGVRHRPAAEVLGVMTGVFEATGFRRTVLENLLSAARDTFFVVAGVQLFDDELHRGAQVKEGRYLLAQPCVRVRTLARVGRKEGISSSFVNLCTEQANGDMADYLAHLRAWTAALLALGLDADGLALTVEPDLRRRGELAFRTVNVTYFGFELGEAILLRATNDRLAVRSIIDVGFGFERIVWAANEADSYFSLIGPMPYALVGHHRLVDLVRTMTLLAGAGLVPANKGRGHVMRRLAQLACAEPEGSGAVVEEVARHSHAYWSGFLRPRVAAAESVRAVVAEVHRNENVALARRLGLRMTGADFGGSPEEFMTGLLRSRRVDLAALRAALGSP